MAENDDDDPKYTPKAYEVGYGKPPKHTQFKKGTSGNRKGRPKGARNFSTLVRSLLSSKVVIKEDGKTRTVTALEASLLRLRQSALSGGERARDQLHQLAARYFDDQPLADDEKLSEADQDILAEALLRLQDKQALPKSRKSTGKRPAPSTRKKPSPGSKKK